ncbi:hypothetical protein COO60DRAFT_406263 [Scenedesmus sp. NREL 46B-D3]|nr:hypothetical protein COO60DRAFT_406263 [Scenedesmus sp. NREL 46B-D3]
MPANLHYLVLVGHCIVCACLAPCVVCVCVVRCLRVCVVAAGCCLPVAVAVWKGCAMSTPAALASRASVLRQLEESGAGCTVSVPRVGACFGVTASVACRVAVQWQG